MASSFLLVLTLKLVMKIIQNITPKEKLFHQIIKFPIIIVYQNGYYQDFLDSVYEKIDFFHLILPNLYGKGENPNRIIPYLINALEKKEEIKLTSGMQVRQFIHVKDVAESVYCILSNKYPRGIYNLCNKSPVKIKDLAIEVFEIMGYNPMFNDNLFGLNKRSDTAMQYLLMDNSIALSTFHFQPQITLKNGIKHYF